MMTITSENACKTKLCKKVPPYSSVDVEPGDEVKPSVDVDLGDDVEPETGSDSVFKVRSEREKGEEVEGELQRQVGRLKAEVGSTSLARPRQLQCNFIPTQVPANWFHIQLVPHSPVPHSTGPSELVPHSTLS